MEGGDQIKHMVDRFLSWRLPDNFRPDVDCLRSGGDADSDYAYTRKPTGTNLLDATQAEAMVRHMLDGLPASRDRGELVAADTTAMLTIADVRKALQPYVKLAIANRAAQDFSICGITFDAANEEYVSASAGDLRTLMRAAGLWTDEMEYRPLKAADDDDAGADDQMRDATASPVALSAEPEAATAPPPPAEGAGERPDFDPRRPGRLRARL